jgi:hypothetical protein
MSRIIHTSEETFRIIKPATKRGQRLPLVEDYVLPVDVNSHLPVSGL